MWRHFILEGLDRLGKDTLAVGLQNRIGYHRIVHYSRPVELSCYLSESSGDRNQALRRYQEASFRAMFTFLSRLADVGIIYNRAHLGECVYAPYRGYSGEYVLELEKEFDVESMSHVRLVLLTEDMARSRHFVDDHNSLAGVEKRAEEQEVFRRSFAASRFRDKIEVCVTDGETGLFRDPESIVNQVLGVAQ